MILLRSVVEFAPSHPFPRRRFTEDYPIEKSFCVLDGERASVALSEIGDIHSCDKRFVHNMQRVQCGIRMIVGMIWCDSHGCEAGRDDECRGYRYENIMHVNSF